MKYSVNVDFETPNRQGGSTDCREHGKVGPRYNCACRRVLAPRNESTGRGGTRKTLKR